MKRILFVEDDLSLIHGLSYALKKQGYELHIARTYLEAKTLWSKINCDLIILDVSLPDGSGYDLCQDIRKTSKVPILFLTAADEETEITMGLDIGGDDYITKPGGFALQNQRSSAQERKLQSAQYRTKLQRNSSTNAETGSIQGRDENPANCRRI